MAATPPDNASDQRPRLPRVGTSLYRRESGVDRARVLLLDACLAARGDTSLYRRESDAWGRPSSRGEHTELLTGCDLVQPQLLDESG